MPVRGPEELQIMVSRYQRHDSAYVQSGRPDPLAFLGDKYELKERRPSEWKKYNYSDAVPLRKGSKKTATGVGKVENTRLWEGPSKDGER